MTAQMGLDAHEQVAVVERLHQVVVGAGLEPDALVHDVAFRGQEDDRDAAPARTHPLAHVVAVHARHHDVEQQQVGLLPLQHLKPFVPVGGSRTRSPRLARQCASASCKLASSSMSMNLFHGASPRKVQLPSRLGSRRRTRCLRPRRSRRLTLPPCISANSRTRASPRPLPPRRRSGSIRPPARSGRIRARGLPLRCPRPCRTPRRRCACATRRGARPLRCLPPGGENFTALLARFSSTMLAQLLGIGGKVAARRSSTAHSIRSPFCCASGSTGTPAAGRPRPPTSTSPSMRAAPCPTSIGGPSPERR